MYYTKLIKCTLGCLLFITFTVKGEGNVEKYLTDSIPSTWTYSSSYSQTIPTDDNWWTNFNDKTLDSLINVGVKNNYNLLIAAKRIQMAEAAVGQARSQYMPTFNMDAGWVKNRGSANLSSQNYPSVTSDYFSLGVNMSWQIDLFGKITRQVKEGKANQEATKSQYAGAMVTLCGNIATSYVNLRVWQKQYQVALYHAASQKIVYEMALARFNSGLASKLDVAQAQTIYYSTISSLPSLQGAIETQINSLAILIGEYPGAIKSKLMNIKPLPEYNQLIATGIPLDLLRRRPDIMEAEYTLASYAAAAGIAKSDYLPTLTLEGSVGLDSRNLKNIFKEDAFNYSIQPKLSWTIFDGLNRKYSVAAAKEQLMIGIDNYNFTVMTAYQDVENSMINYKYSLNSIAALKIAMDEAKIALDLSIELYKKGLSAFTNVASAQISFLEYNNSLISAEGKSLTSLISLYEALGGGWETSIILNNKK